MYHVPAQFLTADRGTLTGDHRRLDALPPFVVRHADDSHIKDIGVAQKNLLDFGRRNVLTPANDGVVDTSRDEEISLLVEISLVAGVEESTVVDGATDTRIFR